MINLTDKTSNKKIIEKFAKTKVRFDIYDEHGLAIYVELKKESPNEYWIDKRGNIIRHDGWNKHILGNIKGKSEKMILNGYEIIKINSHKDVINAGEKIFYEDRTRSEKTKFLKELKGDYLVKVYNNAPKTIQFKSSRKFKGIMNIIDLDKTHKRKFMGHIGTLKSGKKRRKFITEKEFAGLF